LPDCCVDDGIFELSRGAIPPAAGFGSEVVDRTGIAEGIRGVLFGVLVPKLGVIIGVAVGVAEAAVG